MNEFSFQNVEKAYEVLKEVVNKTPLQYDQYLSEKYEAQIYLKREDLQKVRSFKLRGAYCAIEQLSEEQQKSGIVCASAGNHAQGVAFTCFNKQIPATIFMPSTTPKQKIQQVEFFGRNFIEIVLTGDTFDESAAAAQEFAKNNGKSFIDPFNNEYVIAGQGTIAVEIFDELAKQNIQADYLLGAVGGGGLISGLATYTKHISPATKVLGIEPKGAASMQAAIKAGGPVNLEEIEKFVDGAAVAEVGEKTYQVTKKYVDDVISVDEGQVCGTILELYAKLAIVAEPAGALSVSALESIKEEIKGKTVVCVISGGNNDISRMNEIEERYLIFEGLKHYFVVNFPQRPGALKTFVNEILGPNDDITRFEYVKKGSRGKGPVLVGILLNEKESFSTLVAKLKEFDANYIDLQQNETLYTLLI
ncbi:L-threonine ammonia-lyase [Pilibacter termitis]|uniref:L-threonine dehydratase n=1 Tax=Pilibacter termitis TaxID=263852 RepID=A0A1T4RBP4_9ENTE|nr:threonine ammonia-lyase IlvA [Pilibacter termitis]SKA13118.1 L-threonine ammonia-lyase [Pilibacter termitis]